MKKSRTIIMMTISLLLLSAASMANAATSGANSIEFMCKAKAKEIAAETYKGCVVENKQAQVERIRKEYQSKLAELKNQYNSELKQLSPKKAAVAAAGKPSAALENTNSSEMPAKKMKSSKVKTEKIDFTSGNHSSSTTEVSSSGEQNDSNGDAAPPETEIVEIPPQQE